MGKIYTSVEQLIGNTPLLELTGIEKKYNLKGKILAKLEYLNPAGSVKDRAALQMLVDAEEAGVLRPGGTIIEPTSGNTGIGLSLLAVTRGYRAVIVMPSTMSKERIAFMRAFGARVVLSDGSKGMAGAIEKANELAKEYPGSFIPGQFDNLSNPKAHRLTTGPEIWEDTQGSVDLFLAGVGSGGTISGVGEYLKEKKPSVEIIAVEPQSSPVLSGGQAGPHKIQGIGAGFIPGALNKEIYDRVIQVPNEGALEVGRQICALDGVLVGISSGAAVWAAIEEAKKQENEGKTIVVVLADSGDRYLSTEMFA